MMSCNMRDALVRKWGKINGTYHFKMTTLIGTVLGALKGAAKMEWRIVDELNLDIRVITTLVNTAT